MSILRFRDRNKNMSSSCQVWDRCGLFLVCLFSILFLAGCRVMVGKQKRPLVRATPIRGSLEFDAELSDDKQKTENTEVNNKSTEFRELLRLKTRGDVYHPNFLLFDAMLGLGLSQSRFDTNTDNTSNQGSVREYHIGGQFLPTKSYPSSFYLDRSEDVVPRLFGSPLDIESESRGFTQSLDIDNWPMTFSYRDSTSTQEGDGGTESRDFFRLEEKNFGYTLGHDFSELSRMHFAFDRRLVTQERFNSLNDRQEDHYTFRHNHIFDEKRNYRFDTYFSYLEQSKDFDLEQTLWTERLRLRHSNTFETFYNLLYSETARPGISSDRLQLESGFQHQLYESLFTTSRLFIFENNNNDITEDIWGGDLGFNYTKKNPWGRLRGNVRVAYQNLDQTGGSTTSPIVNERHPFTQAGSLIILLDQRNIDPSTIVVMDSSRLTTYPVSYYTISEIGGYTEIQIPLGGVIYNDGDQDLSFDYSYVTDPERQEESLTELFTIRQEFENGLSIYYEHHVRTQDITTTESDFIPDEYVKNIFGVDYIKSGLKLQAEYRDEDTTRNPQIRKNISGSYLWPLDQDTQLNFFASNNWIKYTDESSEIEQFSIGGGLLSQLSDRYRLISNVIFREDDDSRQGKTKGLDWSTELKYTFRQFSYSAGIEMSSLDHLGQETDNLFLFFNARREF